MREWRAIQVNTNYGDGEVAVLMRDETAALGRQRVLDGFGGGAVVVRVESREVGPWEAVAMNQEEGNA